MELIALVIFITIIAGLATLLTFAAKKHHVPEPYPAPVRCNQNCRQGRDCDCFQRSCDMTVREYDLPNEHWPFPHPKP